MRDLQVNIWQSPRTIVQPRGSRLQAEPRARKYDGRLSDDVFDTHMPSFSSIPDPIAWANNAIQERRRESLSITPAKCGNPVGKQSNLAHTPGDCASRMGKGQNPLVALPGWHPIDLNLWSAVRR